MWLIAFVLCTLTTRRTTAEQEIMALIAPLGELIVMH